MYDHTATVTPHNEDNQSSIALARNSIYHPRTKDFDTRAHFVREQVSNRTLELAYTPTNGGYPHKGPCSNQARKVLVRPRSCYSAKADGRGVQ